MSSASRYITVEDVFVRVIIVALFVSITAGLTLQLLSESSVADRPIEIALYAYLIGSIGGFIIAAPLVHTLLIAKLKRQVTIDIDQILREDRLTGLLNRQEFFRQIARPGTGIAGQPCFFTGGVLLIVDVDDLQQINDDHGNSVGDTALVAVSSAIGKSVRDIDFMSRIAGEEFGIFLPAVDQLRGLEIAERIRMAVLETQMFANDAQLDLRVSIGVAFATRNTPVSASMLNADLALQDAKQRGKNCVVACQGDCNEAVIEGFHQAA